ncbi:MAG: hypothetical protein B6U69_02275 [Thermofilum sp. ex4484_15]|nr:MAG: hypothetical protein B6U69_02275 [Thermofilum sp. ex4484_15]
MYVVAVSDVHSPRYFDLFERALSKVKWSEVSLMILAGDMILKGRIKEYDRVIKAIRRYYDGKIIGVFGNEEYEKLEPTLIEEYGGEILWLNDEDTYVKLDTGKVAIYGTRGILDIPTPWQRKHVPDITHKYLSRLDNLAKWLKKDSGGSLSLMVSHYAVTYKTMVGERERIWPMLGSKRVERLIAHSSLDVAIHGHVHKSKVLEASLGNTKVYNVALIARGELTKITLSTRKGLLEYL